MIDPGNTLCIHFRCSMMLGVLQLAQKWRFKIAMSSRDDDLVVQPIWDPETSKQVLGSNPLVCK